MGQLSHQTCTLQLSFTGVITPNSRKGRENIMLATVIFSNTYWTFWDVMLLFFVWIPLLMLWFFCIADVFRRHDIGGGAKALWLVAIIIFPWIGCLVYLIARPSDPVAYGTAA